MMSDCNIANDPNLSNIFSIIFHHGNRAGLYKWNDGQSVLNTADVLKHPFSDLNAEDILDVCHEIQLVACLVASASHIHTYIHNRVWASLAENLGLVPPFLPPEWFLKIWAKPWVQEFSPCNDGSVIFYQNLSP
jgi:hypothetical protein